MFKNNKKYVIFLILLFGLYVALEYYAPRPIDWTYSFQKKDKIPYGCFILNDIFPNIFKGQSIIENSKSFYENLWHLNTEKENLIIITNLFRPDQTDLNELMSFIKRGNHAFVSAMFFDKKFLDTLKLKTKFHFYDTAGNKVLNFVNPIIKKDTGYLFDKALSNIYFTKFDTLHTTVLGTRNNKEVNFIKVKYGAGNILVHCEPLAFTNYHLLYSNYEYACTALSYLPQQKTIWDEYYKPGNIPSGSPIRFILSHPSFKAAYILLMITLIVYIIFEGRRKQRVIPVIEPLKNTSLEFIETIGRVYLHEKNHKNIALKKYKHFKDYIASKFFIYKFDNEDIYIDKLSQKSGVKLFTIKSIFDRAKIIQSKDKIEADELIGFTKSIEKFYELSKRKFK